MINRDDPGSQPARPPAENMTEADDWLYFESGIDCQKRGLFKAHKDGSGIILLAGSSKWYNPPNFPPLRNIRVENEWVYFEATEEYSEADEEHMEFNRYRDEVQYKVKTDGKELTELYRSHGYLGSSD